MREAGHSSGAVSKLCGRNLRRAPALHMALPPGFRRETPPDPLHSGSNKHGSSSMRRVPGLLLTMNGRAAEIPLR